MVEQILSLPLISQRKTAPLVSENLLSQDRTIFLLRLSLAIVFFWFGMLKLINMSPVIEFLQNSFPILARTPFLQLLGVGEIAIAVGLLIDKFSKYAAI